MKVTIRDVARGAAVSIQTVSNVLNRRPGVGTETRRHVREVAQRLGYRPSWPVRSLRGGRSQVILTGPLNSWSGVRRLDGYRKALTDWGQQGDSRFEFVGDFNVQSGADGVRALLDRGVTFDGIVAGNDLMAIGAIGRLRERGFRVPEDVAIIGYDNSQMGQHDDPQISTIAQPKYELGHRGVELLLDQISAIDRDPETPPPVPRTEILDCELLVRRSSSGLSTEVRCGSIFSDAPWLVARTKTSYVPLLRR